MMNVTSRITIAACALSLLLAAECRLQAQTTDFQVYRGTQVPPEVERIYEKGLKFLTSAQNADGSFPGQYGSEPGVVGMALILAGVALFSGSIFGLVLFEIRALGPVTPIGGLCLLAGWASLVLLARTP